MAIFDALGQYASNRFNRAIDNMGQTFSNPMVNLQQRMAEEEEEERKRREREQQMMAEMQRQQADQQAAQTAVKQTIVTQPDGSQEMTIKGTPQALSGMNPNTPTVTGPAIPDVMGQQQQEQQRAIAAAAEEERRRLEQQQQAQQAQMMQQQAMAQAAPVAGPVAPDTGPTPDEIIREAEQRRQYQQMMAQPAPASQAVSPQQAAAGQGPQPVVRFGEPMPEPPKREPAPAPLVQMAQAQAGTRTDVTAPTTGAVAQPPAPDFSQRFQGILTNQQELARVLATSQDPAERKIAADLLRVNLQGQQDEQKAAATVSAALQGDRDAQTQMQRDLKRPEGSYVKAYLFARLGLNQLAQEEQEKLGQGSRKVSQVVSGKDTYTVETDSRGQILRAWDANGDRSDNKTIARLQAAGQRTGAQVFGFTGGSLVIPAGQPDAGQEYRQRTNSVTGQIENVITSGPRTGEIYTGPAGIERRVGTQAQVDYNAAMIRFQTQPNTAAATEALKFAVDAYGVGSPEVQRAQAEINRRLGPGALNTIIQGVPGMQQAPAAAPTGAPAAVPAPARPVPAAQPPAASAAAQPTRPVAPTPAAPAAAPAAVAPAAMPTSGTIGSNVPLPGESPAAFRQRMAVQQAGAEREATTVAEDVGKIRNNFGTIKDSTDIVTNLADELRAHPGFSVGVGASAQPGFQFIPGTDKYNFYTRFDEIKGRQFLAAIEQLKGTGAISDREGEAATKAVSRLSLGQSEQEFRKALHEFESMMRRYADRAAKKIGQPALYNEPDMTTQRRENSAAKRWLEQNPRDPRAEEVRNKLIQRGEL